MINELKTRPFDGNINTALMLLDQFIDNYGNSMDVNDLINAKAELIKFIERKCVPVDRSLKNE
jgi:hypothetical protein